MSQELPHQPLFIADAMLGRLARWLRLLGFDTLYYQDIRDGDLLKAALREGRFILTRDSHFLKLRDSRGVLLIHSDHPMEQVREVVTYFKIMEFRPGRCPRCNGILHAVDRKESVRDAVPEHVFFGRDNFQLCRSCGKVYWEGTHLERFREMIHTVLKNGGPEVTS